MITNLDVEQRCYSIILSIFAVKETTACVLEVLEEGVFVASRSDQCTGTAI